MIAATGQPSTFTHFLCINKTEYFPSCLILGSPLLLQRNKISSAVDSQS